jgi:hypothetical protein
MLVGLLRLRLEMGEFGLGRILWNQVRCRPSGKMSFDNLTKLDVASRIIAR